MLKKKLLSVLVIVGIGAAQFVGVSIGQKAAAQTVSQSSQNIAGNPGYDLQRSIRIDRYNQVAESGPARGEVLYFYKCWMCHNQFTIKAEFGDKAPFLQLKDLYSREKLLTGEPVNDTTVAEKIKNGGPGMPTFGTTLTDSDIADLVSYLSEDNCCYESEDPPGNPWYRASTQKWGVPTTHSGGPRGVVRSSGGAPIEGIGVQLIAPNAVRTTVYSNEAGGYEFPQMQSGEYTLRIATPLEFLPYQQDSVRIQGAAKLEDIVLESIASPETSVVVSDSGLPHMPEIASQLTGAEWLWNLAGTSLEKSQLHRSCGSGCHDYQRIFRNRYDERSWRLIVNRMYNYSGRTLINPTKGSSTRGSPEQRENLVKWLAKVRGPDSEEMPLRTFPRPQRAATRVVVTEYELPRALLLPHDVAGDSKGNIWYTSHKTPYIGELDPRTGIVTEYKIPSTPGALSGTHRIAVDNKNGIVWASDNWGHNVVRLDMQTKLFTLYPVETDTPLNSPAFSNFGLAPDGSIWDTNDGAVAKLDPRTTGTAEPVQQWPLAKEPDTYDNLISADGNFWAGGSPSFGGQTIKLLDIRTGNLSTFETSRRSSPARGGFDPEGNPWFGGRGGSLITLNVKAGLIREYWPPTPYTPFTSFYEAMPDKNGEVWAGVLHGKSFVRLDPRTERWIQYVLPEPFANNYRTWIDNSTNPVTVWYVDYKGYIVRIQPME